MLWIETWGDKSLTQNKHTHKKRKKAEVLLASSKETIISCVWKSGHSKDQAQDLYVRVARFQESKSLTPNSEHEEEGVDAEIWAG